MGVLHESASQPAASTQLMAIHKLLHFDCLFGCVQKPSARDILSYANPAAGLTEEDVEVIQLVIDYGQEKKTGVDRKVCHIRPVLFLLMRGTNQCG